MTRRRARRGIVLLIILSLLVIFMMMAVTFVVVSGQYHTAARQFANDEIQGDDPALELDKVMYQVLRDSRPLQGPVTPLWGHSLLRDLYGSDSIVSRVLTTNTLSSNSGAQENIRITFSPIAGHQRGEQNGRVLTLLDGPQAMHSGRIFDCNLSQGWVHLVDTELGNGIQPNAQLVGSRFLINGQAFNGTGAGYNPGGGNLDQAGPGGAPVALMPNFTGYTGINPYQGGADESYDAVDFQNMFLAMAPPRGSTLPTIPSFHRPALINFWINHSSGAWGNVQFRNSVVMRPMPWSHPNFTGSNPNFNLLNGPWDVDNNGDGLPDSIFIDPGLPVKTTPDGRRYKALAAILITDLDGRLNINAGGNRVHLDANYSLGPLGSISPAASGPYPGNRTPTLTRGTGRSPAEINLSRAFINASEYSAVLLGKYGGDGRPGLAGHDPLSSLNSYGISTSYLGIPSIYASPPDAWGYDMVAQDVAGQPFWSFKGTPNQLVDEPWELDLSVNGPRGANMIDNPYSVAELERLLRWHDSDAPTLPDRLVRLAPGTFNSNSNINVNVGIASEQRRNLVTTESRRLPIPNVSLPIDLRRGGSGLVAPTVADLFRVKLRNAGVLPANINAELLKMLPRELLHGDLFDINRPLGNGRDDNGNGVVDEPQEAVAAGGERLRYDDILPVGYRKLPAYYNTIPFNHLNNDPLITNRGLARQIYARHLYCLAMFLMDRSYNFPLTGPLPPGVTLRELTAQKVAQWAINVVDFRDPDAIMTPFEYDINPLDGWQNMDGDLRTNEGGQRRFVWGCEYPELLLSETLAFHDRRVKDTDNDPTMQKRLRAGTTMTPGDDDLDQYQIPQGSLFFELYCARHRYVNNPSFPRELYNVNPATRQAFLDLGRLSPLGGRNFRQPVWRVAVIEDNPARGPSGFPGRGRPPGVPGPPAGANPPWNRTTGVERYVWFTPLNPGANHPERSRIFYGRTGTVNANGITTTVGLETAHYAVVGPRPVTYIGSRSDDTRSAQRIALNSGIGMVRTDVNGADAMPGNIQAPLTIIAGANPPAGWVDTGRTAPLGIGLSISEPLPASGYYREPTTSLYGGTPLDFYDDPDPAMRQNTLPDAPFDSDPSTPLGFDGLTHTGTRLNYKRLQLERLANPLLPWNPMPPHANYNSGLQVNPYIEMDRSPVDLTVFNGSDRRPATFPAALDPFDPSDPDPDGVPDERFGGRERGSRAVTGPADTRLWPQVTTAPPITGKSGPPENYFPFNLRSTLGYLNTSMGQRIVAPPSPTYVGDPNTPFPWLTWYNRPFASNLELMLVPHTSASDLLKEYSINVGGGLYDTSTVDRIYAPHRHLLNFFHCSAGSGASPHLYRLFDFTETPSPFVKTKKWLNFPLYANMTGYQYGFTYRPPYNHLSNQRDPGAVNINTIIDQRVWRGVARGFPSMDSSAFWNRIERSRQDYGGTLYSLDSSKPTRFGNPFRSAASADLMPSAGNLVKTRGIDATLMRPVFGSSSQALFDYTSGNPYNHTGRSPTFRYQGLTRLGNLLSTHSNVFAVWITIAYFEVEPNPGGIDAAHPDGWRLGPEIGLETANVKRHRAFYIIDRSMPVAFQPGENHNVDRAIRLRRFIE